MADASYLCTYPILLIGILLLAKGRLSLTSKARVTADGLIIMTAAFAFSWYFVLGPTVLQTGESLFARVIGTAYPLGDLLLLACILVLSFRVKDLSLRPVVISLFLGLSSIIVADTVFDYQTLHGTYATGELIDVGWPLGDMLICLAAVLLLQRAAVPAETPREETVDGDIPHYGARRVWGTLVAYAFVPPVGALLIYTTVIAPRTQFESGVVLGCIALVGVVLCRQVLAILENAQLSDRLQANNGALREANRRLEGLATTDLLTGLPNHRALIAALDHELERANRFNRPCSLVFLDLDHFKALNDSLGHSAGDAALNELATVVRTALRGIDILGRWGGEEFLVLLPEADTEGALQAAERIRATAAAHPLASWQGARLTCSLGVASYPRDAEDRDSLIEMADRAMYAAKRLGRNQVRGIGDAAVRALTVDTGTAGSRDDAALMGTVEALAALVDARDNYTGRHSYEVAALSKRLALALGLEAREVQVIGLAARLHDAGKVAVRDAVLRKPGRLTPEEWSIIRTHSIVGADVVSRVPSLRALAPTIRAHHERWDGQGYPDQLAGTAIPLGARVIAVADAYQAMTTDRPYRSRITPELALEELRRCAGSQFDEVIVGALERLLRADMATRALQEAV